MLRITRLVKPAVKVVESRKALAKRSIVSKKSSHRFVGLKQTPIQMKRWYCQGRVNEESVSGPIVTVDKWGVQREASEVSKAKEGKTSYTHGAPATEMLVFEVSKLNFQETLQSQAPVIIMAYLPRYELKRLKFDILGP